MHYIMKVYMEGKNMQLELIYDSVKNSDFIEFTNFEVGPILSGPMCSLYLRRVATIRF